MLLNVPAGATAPTFAAHVDFGTGLRSERPWLGTTSNKDSNPDLVIANAGSNTVSVLLNTTAPGAATPSFASNDRFLLVTTPTSLIHSGFDSMATVSPIWRSPTAVRTRSRCLKTPPFPERRLSPLPPNRISPRAKPPWPWRTPDLNADGVPDLAGVNATDNTVSVLIYFMTAPVRAAFRFSKPRWLGIYQRGPVQIYCGD